MEEKEIKKKVLEDKEVSVSYKRTKYGFHMSISINGKEVETDYEKGMAYGLLFNACRKLYEPALRESQEQKEEAI